MVRFLLALVSLCVAAPAFAQDDFGFDLDTVLVATFEADKKYRKDADRYAKLFEAALADQMVFTMADVPEFTDYDAATYVDSCPDGQYVACLLVVAARVGSEWAVGGQLTPLEGGAHQVKLAIVDVDDAQLILQFDVVFDGAQDDEIITGFQRVFQDVLGGRYTGTDIRQTEPEIPEDEIPVDIGPDEETKRSKRNEGKRRKLTRDDTDDYEATDAVTPWEQRGLNKTSWRRWKNSGKSLVEWKARARGRQGEILVGLTALTVGQGSWTQVYEGWYALDDPTLETIETSTMIDQARGIERTWDFSLGVGIMPWLDVQAFGGPRIAPYQLRVQRIIENQDTIIDDPIRRTVSSYIVGGRIGFQPLPTFPARPTLHLGAYYWRGVQHTRVVESPEELAVLDAPWMVIVQGGPGFEVDLGKYFYLWGRLYVDVPVAGRISEENAAAGPLLADRPRPDTTDDGVGIAGSFGVTVRLRIPTKGKKKTPGRRL
jgi:hypothetical protein